MPLNNLTTSYVQAHKCDGHFNYNLVVDWAIEQLEQGMETPNMLMLASFGSPFEIREISPYIAAALKDLGLQEIDGDDAVNAIIRYYATEILLNHSLRSNLQHLHKLALEYDQEFGLVPFYCLYYAWNDLEQEGYNFYYDGATLENIESILQKEASDWLKSN